MEVVDTTVIIPLALIIALAKLDINCPIISTDA